MKKIFLLLAMGFMLNSCGPQENPDPPTTKPTITTGQIIGITATTATCSENNVTTDGGSAVTARGVCWSTSQNPTTANSKTTDDLAQKTKSTDGTGLGTYTSNITGLSPNTTYYVRAYATNSVGTAYGEQRTFTTNAQQGMPSVTTEDVTNITITTANCGGNVTADGGAVVTARGVCWSTSQNPTTSNSKTTNGTGLGTFTSNITVLSPNSTYYVRAYATNSQGTAYGEQRTFKTLTASDIEYGSFTDSRDGHVYKTVTIGEQVWMAENLAYLPIVVGPEACSLEPGHEADKYYYVNGYNGTDVAAAKATTNYQTYGVLYNWPAAMNGATSSDANPSGVQGICPDGWHLPSDAEWMQLESFLAKNGYNFDGSISSEWDDPRLKIAISLASATGWAASYFLGVIGNTNTAYDIYRNKSGFSALPGGYRVSGGRFSRIGIEGGWWSSTQIDTIFAWDRNLTYTESRVDRLNGVKGNGLSVRCVRD